MQTAVFTIISPNYTHYARVLMASLERHQPDWQRFVLVTGAVPGRPEPEAHDAPRDPRDRSYTTVVLEALALPSPRQLCFRYTILELNTATKPWMFEYLFERGFDRVVYLDPDIQVFSPLAELDALPPETLLALTPHVTAPSDEDRHCPERVLLRSGAYNLGFLAAWRRPQLPHFLRWWQGKLEHQCLNEPERGGVFVDQKWMDLAPGLFEGVSILRHDGYNVAYWNLGRRTIEIAGNDATVHGLPLRFIHFSGFGGRARDKVSSYGGLEMAAIGAARVFFEDYATTLDEAGRDTFASAPYAYGTFADGSHIKDEMRFTYRNSQPLQRVAGSDPFAHPELFNGIAARVRDASQLFVATVRPLLSRLVPVNSRTPFRAALRMLDGRLAALAAGGRRGSKTS